MTQRTRLSPLALTLSSALLLSSLAPHAVAQTALTPKAQYAQDSKEATTRYEADKGLCSEETSSNARLQCRRDAKAAYDAAIAKAKAQLAATPGKTSAAKVACFECGKVLSVTQAEKEGEGGALGMIAGGVTGALLGRQVGGGFGKDLATIAGAAGGAYAGKKIEEKVKTQTVWTVNVQYADGRQGRFDFAQDPGFKAGDAVKNSGNTLVRD
jgi:outer membrane lipoprotein SlyB